jgi:hypothetical protein
VGRQIVRDEVDFFAARLISDGFREKGDELSRSVAGCRLPQNFTGPGVECCV